MSEKANISETNCKKKEKNKGGNPAWSKGISGNPSGRPKTPEYYKNAINELSELGLDMMKKILVEDKINGEKVQIRYKADVAKYVVDRKYGKATQTVDATINAEFNTNFKMSELTDEEIKNLEETCKKIVTD